MNVANYETYAGLKAWSPEDFGKFNAGENLFYEAEIGIPCGHGARLFEIGFGNGSLLGWAAANGYLVSGHELQPGLVERATAAGFDTVQNMSALSDQFFDIVAALDVFEHIEAPDLGILLAQIYAALKPGGKLIARFPNGDSPFSMPTFNGDLTHINWLGSGKIDMLMAAAGFNAYELRAPKEAFGLAGRIKYAPKAFLRGAFRQFVKASYLGRSAPSTFHLNYLLVATK